MFIKSKLLIGMMPITLGGLVGYYSGINAKGLKGFEGHGHKEEDLTKPFKNFVLSTVTVINTKMFNQDKWDSFSEVL